MENKRSLKLTNNGDVIVDPETNDFVYIDGLEEKAQSLRIRLSTQRGEWAFDTIFGLDYEKVIGKGRTQEEIKLEIIETILQDQDVERAEVYEFKIDPYSRDLDVKAKAYLVTGEEIPIEL